MNKFSGLLLGGFAAVFAHFAVADEGKVLTAVGPVSVVRDGKEFRLNRGETVRTGDLIKVAEDGSAQIRMSDESIIALSPRTEFKITEYKFARETPTEGKALFALIKGAFRTVTGLIGQQARENYAVKAGVVATIGIRGTHYRLRVCESDCGGEGAAPANGLYGGVTEGRIGVANESGTEEFGADEYFYVADAASRAERLPGPPDLLIDRATFLSKLKREGSSAPSAGAAAATLPTLELAAAPSPLGATAALANLTQQQFRPTEFTATPTQLAHVAPIGTGGFVDVGASGEIRGQIVWMTNADIDLHMLPPVGSSVYFGNPTAAVGTLATARLDHDNLGGVIDVAPDKRAENIVVSGSQIPTGNYVFHARSFSGNNNGLPTLVQVRVTGNGNATSLTDSVTLSSGQSSSNYIVNYQGTTQAPTYSIGAR